MSEVETKYFFWSRTQAKTAKTYILLNCHPAGHEARPQDEQLLAGDAAQEGDERAERGEGPREGHRAGRARGGLPGFLTPASHTRDGSS